MNLRLTEQIIHSLLGQLHGLHFGGRDLARDLARHLSDLPLELAHTSLTRVPRYHLAHRVVIQQQLTLLEPRLGELARDQESLGDRQFIALGIAAELDFFHAVQQRTRDVLPVVGRRDEQHFGQIERHAEVVVRKRVVLRGVQHLEQCRSGISLERDAQLVHLVQ